jgi:taurine dioxygenase
VASLRRALVEHGVLFFRDQRIGPAQQAAFARQFGHVPRVPDSMFRVHPESPLVSVLENDAERPPTVNNWHSDYSFAAEPDVASVLRAVVVPEVGGDTVWASMYAAYEGLSDRMQHHLDGLVAAHDFMKLYERPAKKALWQGERGRLMEEARRAFPPVYHPVVRVHPETGRKALFVNESFTRHVDGMTESESRALLGYLFEQARTPEYQVRFAWSEGAVAMWDNRSTVHYAVADYYPRHRLMHRVTVLERPRAAEAVVE